MTAYVLTDPRQAHTVVNTLYQQAIKPQVAAGTAVHIHVEPADPVHRHQLRKLFHGPVLEAISLQTRIYQPAEDRHVRYTKAAWKEFFRDMFCPDESTESLSDEEFH